MPWRTADGPAEQQLGFVGSALCVRDWRTPPPRPANVPNQAKNPLLFEMVGDDGRRAPRPPRPLPSQPGGPANALCPGLRRGPLVPALNCRAFTWWTHGSLQMAGDGSRTR